MKKSFLISLFFIAIFSVFLAEKTQAQAFPAIEYVDATDFLPGSIVARGENNNPPYIELATMAFDNNNTTKWLDLSANTHITYQFPTNTSVVIEGISLRSANDHVRYPGRSPRQVVVRCDNQNIITLVFSFTQDLERQERFFSNALACRNVMLIINNQSGAQAPFITQMAEIELLAHYSRVPGASNPSPFIRQSNYPTNIRYIPRQASDTFVGPSFKF